ncbi:uncharacterized protein LOC118142817 isoform X2 [Callithrix jacchus]
MELLTAGRPWVSHGAPVPGAEVPFRVLALGPLRVAGVRCSGNSGLHPFVHPVPFLVLRPMNPTDEVQLILGDKGLGENMGAWRALAQPSAK